MSSKMPNKIIYLLNITVKTVVELVISLALLLTVGPILLLLVLIAEVIRGLIISRMLQHLFKGKVKLMDGTDAIWEFRKPHNSRNILIPVICKKPLDPLQYASDFQENILNYTDDSGQNPYRKFTKIATKMLGYHCWRQDENFNIRNHVRLVEGLEGTERKIFTDTDLMELLPRLNKDMDESKPQWEEIIVPRFSHDGGAVKSLRIFRFHHGYMDGVSYLLMTGKCCVEDPKSFPFPFSVDKVLRHRHLKKSFWNNYLKRGVYFTKCFLFGPIQAVKTLYMCNTVQNPFVARDFAPKTNFAWTKKISVNALKVIKESTGFSLPCILASVTAGGIRRFLIERKKNSIPNIDYNQAEDNSKLIAGFVTLMTPFQNLLPQNSFTVTHLKLAVEDGLSPKALLGIMDKHLKKLNTSPDIYVNYWFLKIVGRLPAFLIQVFMKDSGSPVVLSNVPWATSKVKIFGNEVEDTGAWTPLLTFSGMGILYMSYNGFMRVCLSAQEHVLSKEELKIFLHALEAEVEEFGRAFNVIPFRTEPGLTISVVDNSTGISSFDDVRNRFPLGRTMSSTA